MSICTLLSLSSIDSSKEDNIEAMPGLDSYSSETRGVQSQWYRVTLAVGPRSWS